MTHKPLIVANWKMNLLPNQAEKLCADLIKRAHEWKRAPIIIAPSFESIPRCSALLKKSRSTIKLCAQDCVGDKSGAYTGGVSARSLQYFGCKYCIIGHSERRRLFGETDAMIAQKFSFIINQTSLTPILCVGETAGERKEGIQKKIIKRQIEKAFHAVSLSRGRKIIIAYEPVWAIGTGRPATGAGANEVVRVIRNTVVEGFGRGAADGDSGGGLGVQPRQSHAKPPQVVVNALQGYTGKQIYVSYDLVVLSTA